MLLSYGWSVAVAVAVSLSKYLPLWRLICSVAAVELLNRPNADRALDATVWTPVAREFLAAHSPLQRQTGTPAAGMADEVEPISLAPAPESHPKTMSVDAPTFVPSAAATARPEVFSLEDCGISDAEKGVVRFHFEPENSVAKQVTKIQLLEVGLTDAGASQLMRAVSDEHDPEPVFSVHFDHHSLDESEASATMPTVHLNAEYQTWLSRQPGADAEEGDLRFLNHVKS